MKGFLGSAAGIAAAALASFALAMAIAPSASASPTTYLALGDSVTFGFDPLNPTVTSYGDQGFVKPFADYLGQLTGSRPTVANLAISGETSDSFFSGTPPQFWTYRTPDTNLNYASNLTESQNALMVSTINSIHASGGSVGYVSLLLGGNDLQYLAGTPAFQTAIATNDVTGLQMMVGGLLQNIQANYVHALGELKMLAPEATILLPGYYNPYAPLGPGYALFGQAIQAFNGMISADAAATPGAKYVNLYSPFVGNELTLTNIGIGDIHPKPDGYREIASQLDAAAVPEPSSILVFSVGIAGLALVRHRRRRAA